MTDIITTTDIQILEIALICSKAEDHSTVMSEDEYNRLMGILERMHHLCKAENGYSLVMEVQERRFA